MVLSKMSVSPGLFALAGVALLSALAPTSPARADAIARIRVETAVLRAEPGQKAKTRALLDKGDSLRIDARKGSWCRVTTGSGTTGWVRSDLVQIVKVVKPESPAAKKKAALAKAKAQKLAAAKAKAQKIAAAHAKAQKSAAAKAKAQKIAAKAKLQKIAASKAKNQKAAAAKAKALKIATAKAKAHKAAANAKSQKLAAAKSKSLKVAAEQKAAKARANKIALAKANAQKIATAKARASKVAAANRAAQAKRVAKARVAARAKQAQARRARTSPAYRTASAARRAAAAASRKFRNAGGLTSGNDVVRTAMAYRGVPYRFGARNGKSFDCSGFTSYMFEKKGTPLPRTAAEQYKRGTAVDRSEMKPGDLVFFKNTYKRGVSHVGIYVGEGKFIHASSGGGKVEVDSLNSAYYTKKWAGARRAR